MIVFFAGSTSGVRAKENYVDRSELASGSWIKIAVSENGFYKLTYEDLISMGVKDPRTVRVHGYGGAMLEENFALSYKSDIPEQSIYMNKGADGVFGKGDYIIFYGQGPTSWRYDGVKFVHKENVYSRSGYYFITSGAREANQVVNVESVTSVSKDNITTYIDYYVHELEEQNLVNSGKEFYGETFTGSNIRYNYSIDVPNIVSGKAYITTNVAGKSSSASAIVARYNGRPIDTVNIPTLSDTEYIIKARAAMSTKEFTISGNADVEIDLRYNASNKIAWLNYFELNYPRLLAKRNGVSLSFRSVEYLGSTDAYTYTLQGVGAGTQIWDITDKSNIKNVPYTIQGSMGSFVDKVVDLKEYVAIDPVNDSFLKPVVLGKITNQNLHANYDVDMLIISHKDFMPAANKLANWHRENEGMSVVVADAELVYNEFSSGMPDATAYRRYAKMIYDKSGGALKYLLLFGDGSFDNRQILAAATDKEIYRLMTYQSTYSLSSTSSYATDDYFTFLGDETGTNLSYEKMDISVGRIPVYSVDQAEDVVDKMLKYMDNTQYGVWKNSMVFMADDGDNNEHVSSADDVADLSQSLFPDMEIKKIYLDAYEQEVSAAGASYPSAEREFDSYIKNGTLLINYMGHGGYNGWADEQILSSADIENMYNDHLPLWVTATCDFSRFDDFKDSGGERLLFNPNGGAMGLFTTSRTVYAGPNRNLNLKFMEALLSRDEDGKYVSIGEAVRIAKNKMTGDANRLSFILLGNPAMKLNFPTTHKVMIDSVNGEFCDGVNIDTIRALQEVCLSGSLVKEDGRVDVSFNGVVHISVYDKEEKITTLCNDAGAKPFTFNYRNSKLFSGSTVVKDGRYTITFRLPKDIRYNYGNAKIVAYAYDEVRYYEANGSTEELIVGGEDENIEYENDGPEIQMYINTDAFVDGVEVNSSPLFVAKVYDESGINTTGTGIGHDIILRLNNNPQMEFVLNTYYVSNIGDYKRGELRYTLTDLPEGNYELYFRVWDLQNNSSNASLNFRVADMIEPELYSVYTYPNPTSNVVNFVIEHDRPSSPVDVKVDIFDLTGQRMWSSGKNIITDGSAITELQWNLQSDSGILVGTGIYLAKVTFTDASGGYDIKTVKILVK